MLHHLFTLHHLKLCLKQSSIFYGLERSVHAAAWTTRELVVCEITIIGNLMQAKMMWSVCVCPGVFQTVETLKTYG